MDRATRRTAPVVETENIKRAPHVLTTFVTCDPALSSKQFSHGRRNHCRVPDLVVDRGKRPELAPMSEQKTEAIKHGNATNIPTSRLLTWPERCLRAADRVDHAIRGWVIPLPAVNRPVIAAWGASQSPPHSDVSRSEGLLNEIQAAIGRSLRAEYDVAQPIPDRIADLLRQFEQQDGQSEQVA